MKIAVLMLMGLACAVLNFSQDETCSTEDRLTALVDSACGCGGDKGGDKGGK